MRVNFGYYYRYTARNGGVISGGGDGFATKKDAMMALGGILRMVGWQPPLWWQWWRWNDSPRDWPFRPRTAAHISTMEIHIPGGEIG